jgi:hypothetical protein
VDWVTLGEFGGGERFGLLPRPGPGRHETAPATFVVEVFPAIRLSP